jgi:hypothetical protein
MLRVAYYPIRLIRGDTHSYLQLKLITLQQWQTDSNNLLIIKWKLALMYIMYERVIGNLSYVVWFKGSWLRLVGHLFNPHPLPPSTVFLGTQSFLNSFMWGSSGLMKILRSSSFLFIAFYFTKFLKSFQGVDEMPPPPPSTPHPLCASSKEIITFLLKLKSNILSR